MAVVVGTRHDWSQRVAVVAPSASPLVVTPQSGSVRISLFDPATGARSYWNHATSSWGASVVDNPTTIQGDRSTLGPLTVPDFPGRVLVWEGWIGGNLSTRHVVEETIEPAAPAMMTAEVHQ